MENKFKFIILIFIMALGIIIFRIYQTSTFMRNVNVFNSSNHKINLNLEEIKKANQDAKEKESTPISEEEKEKLQKELNQIEKEIEKSIKNQTNNN